MTRFRNGKLKNENGLNRNATQANWFNAESYFFADFFAFATLVVLVAFTAFFALRRR
jgi:hypothetical protein